eukprot:scaffold19857_cov112-Isochrysis_galbana.AAC.1
MASVGEGQSYGVPTSARPPQRRPNEACGGRSRVEHGDVDQHGLRARVERLVAERGQVGAAGLRPQVEDGRDGRGVWREGLHRGVSGARIEQPRTLCRKKEAGAGTRQQRTGGVGRGHVAQGILGNPPPPRGPSPAPAHLRRTLRLAICRQGVTRKQASHLLEPAVLRHWLGASVQHLLERRRVEECRSGPLRYCREQHCQHSHHGGTGDGSAPLVLARVVLVGGPELAMGQDVHPRATGAVRLFPL